METGSQAREAGPAVAVRPPGPFQTPAPLCWDLAPRLWSTLAVALRRSLRVPFIKELLLHTQGALS